MSNNQVPPELLDTLKHADPSKIVVNEDGTVVLTDEELAKKMTDIVYPDGIPEGGGGGCNLYCPGGAT